jgi:hypothetical protein
MSEHESLIEYSHDKIGESKNHHHREGDVGICMYRTIVPEHDSDICEVPPESKRQYNERDICDEESDISEWFEEIGVHSLEIIRLLVP